jgi:hypothetical protein
MGLTLKRYLDELQNCWTEKPEQVLAVGCPESLSLPHGELISYARETASKLIPPKGHGDACGLFPMPLNPNAR